MSNDKKRKKEEGRDKRREESEEHEHLFEDWDDLAGEADPSRMSRLEGLMPDILKRSIVSGIGSVFMSEDGIRSMLSESKLPKEAVSYLISQADSTKRDFFRIVSREIREFLENMDFGGELTKILTSVSFEIRTEVRFIPNESAVKPNVKNRVAIRKANGEEEILTDELGDPPSDVEDEAGPGKRKGRWSLRNRGQGSPEAPAEGEDD